MIGRAIPIESPDIEPRCWRCDRMLAYLVGRPWRIKCSRCSAMNASQATSLAEIETK